jgi:hypothetical protein
MGAARTAARLVAALAFAAAPHVVAAAPLPGKGDPVVIDDFEAGALDAGWKLEGGGMQRVAAGAGGALELAGGPPEGYGTASRPLPVKDLRGFASLSFKTESSGPGQGQIVLLGASGERGRYRAFDFPGGTKEHTFPLAWFQRSVRGMRGDMAAMDRIRIRAGSKDGSLRIDDLRLLPGDRPDAGERGTVEEWTKVAFPDGKARAVAGRLFTLVTDVKDFAGPGGGKLLSKMDEGPKTLASSFRIEAPAKTRFVFLLFSDKARLQKFRGDMLDAFGETRDGAEIGDVVVFDDGVASHAGGAGGPSPTLIGYGATAPLIAARLQVEAGSTWFHQVGRAVMRRLDAGLYATNLPAGADALVPSAFESFLGGGTGRLPRLAQLPEAHHVGLFPAASTSFFEFLEAKHKPKLPAVWDAVARAEVPVEKGAVELIAKTLGTTPEDLEKDWAKWGAANWGKKD